MMVYEMRDDGMVESDETKNMKLLKWYIDLTDMRCEIIGSLLLDNRVGIRKATKGKQI